MFIERSEGLLWISETFIDRCFGVGFLIDRSLKSLDNFSTKKTEEGILSCNAIGILQ